MSAFIHQPQDKLFKSAMADKRAAREFFETHLPTDILERIDLNTIQLEKHSFIDDTYKATEADVVYSVKQGNLTTYFYLLCEHQSSIDPLISFRLLVYKVRLMELHLKQHPKTPLPLVYSLVVYTGEKLWDAPLNVTDLMHNPKELAQQVFFQPYQLIDVQRLTDATLRQNLWSGLIAFVLKYRETRDLANYLKILLPWLEEVTFYEGKDFARIVLHYVIGGIEANDEKLFIQKVEEYLSSELRGEVMTLAQCFEQKGVHIGEAAMLLTVLKCRFNIIPEHFQKQIEQADSETLLKWGERLLTAPSLEEVFQ